MVERLEIGQQKWLLTKPIGDVDEPKRVFVDCFLSNFEHPLKDLARVKKIDVFHCFNAIFEILLHECPGAGQPHRGQGPLLDPQLFEVEEVLVHQDVVFLHEELKLVLDLFEQLMLAARLQVQQLSLDVRLLGFWQGRHDVIVEGIHKLEKSKFLLRLLL